MLQALCLTTPHAMTILTEKRLQGFRQQNRVQAGSLIISMFGDVIYPRGGGIWLGSLIQLLAPLGVNERLIRTAIYRLVKEDWLQTRSHGRRTDYFLSDSGSQRMEAASQAIYASQSPPWDQRWRLLLLDETISHKDRERLRRTLIWQGFGQWQNQVFVHPGVDLSLVMSWIQREGMGNLQKHLWPLTAQVLPHSPGTTNKQIAATSWDLVQLSQSYRQFVSTYRGVVREWRQTKTPPRGPTNENAFLLRLLLIHDYRRLLLRDPGLPLSLLPDRWPGQAARELCAELYQRLSVPSETYLNQQVQLADGRLTVSHSLFKNRFGLC